MSLLAGLVIQHVNHECSFHGCEEVMAYEEVERHERQCHFRILGRYRVTTAELLSLERDRVAVVGEGRDQEAAHWNAMVGDLVEVELRNSPYISGGRTFSRSSFFEDCVLYRESSGLDKVTLPGGEEREVEDRREENYRLDAAGRLELRLTQEVQLVIGGRLVTFNESVVLRGEKV